MSTPTHIDVIVVADYCPLELGPGNVEYVDQGEVRSVMLRDVERLLPTGFIRLVEDTDSSGPTGGERVVDEGEAGGTDATEPLPTDDAAGEADADDPSTDEDPAPAPADATAEPVDETPAIDTTTLDKDAIVAALTERGVAFDKRWGVDRLRGVLDAALRR